MVNISWAFMAIIGIVYAMLNGTMSQVNKDLLDVANEELILTIVLISVFVFWLGIMRIAEKAGILQFFSALFKPIIYKLFPEIPKDNPAIGYILSNITANMFGLGNAATPMGLKAMEEMKKINNSTIASSSMLTFLALNTSGLTLIPKTVIVIRLKYKYLVST